MINTNEERNTPEVTAEDIGRVLGAIDARMAERIGIMGQAELEEYWSWRWNPQRSPAWNLYEFHTMLGLYQRTVRRWEETHHGAQCVVERVRDYYLWPKIEAFIAAWRAQEHHAPPEQQGQARG